MYANWTERIDPKLTSYLAYGVINILDRDREVIHKYFQWYHISFVEPC